MKTKINFSLLNNIIKKDNEEVVILYEKEKYIPEVKKICKLHKIKIRKVKVACLERERVIKYYVGQYKYYDDASGKIKYITEKIPNVTGKYRHDNETIFMAVEHTIKNEMTISYASKYSRDTLNLTTSVSTIWRWIGIIDIEVEAYKKMEEKVLENFSGHVSVDEVYDGGDGIVILTDPIRDTILSADLVENNVKNDNIVEIFTKLKTKGKEVKNCVRDGSPLYVNTISSIFINVLLQTCIFHLLKNCLKHFMDWHKKLRRETKQIKVGKKKNSKGKKLKQFLYRTRYLFVKKDLSLEERDKLKCIIDAYPRFRILRYLFLKLMRIFSSVSLGEAERRYWDFIIDPAVNDYIPKVADLLKKYYDKNELFTYLLFDKSIRKKIRSSNHTERKNRRFRKKQKTHYRIRKTDRRVKMLRFMVYFNNIKALGLSGRIKVVLFFLFTKKKIKYVKFFHMKSAITENCLIF